MRCAGRCRDLGEAFQRRDNSRVRAGPSARASGPVGVHAAGSGDRGDQRLDASSEDADLRSQGVTLAEQDPGTLGLTGK